MAKKELKLKFVGCNRGAVSKIVPQCALQVGGELALDVIAKMECAYNVSKQGKSFAVEVPSGDLFKILLAANSLANWTDSTPAGALKVILENAKWVESLPLYFDAVKIAESRKAEYKAINARVTYYGRIETVDGEVKYPGGCSEELVNQHKAAKRLCESAAETVSEARKECLKVAVGLLRPSIEKFFTAVK